jgi:hypothetical protein
MSLRSVYTLSLGFFCLTSDLQVGDCIAVRVCTRTVGQINNARQGRLIAKILSEGNPKCCLSVNADLTQKFRFILTRFLDSDACRFSENP